MSLKALLSRSHPWRQTAVLALYLLAALLIERLTDYHPYLLLRWQSSLAGIVAGVALCFIVSAAHSLLLIWRQDKHASALRAQHEQLSSQPLSTTINEAFCSAFGKDLLIRAYIFGYLMAGNLILAFFVNALLTIITEGPKPTRRPPFLAFQPTTSLSTLSVELIKTAFLAAVFLAQRSVFALALAAFFQYLVSSLIIRSSWFGRWLNRGYFTWRSLYELSPYTDERATFNV